MIFRKLILVVAGMLILLSCSNVLAEGLQYSQGASFMGKFPDKCNNSTIIRRDYFEKDAGNCFSSPVPTISPLFDQCCMKISIRGNKVKYSYKKCMRENDCWWEDWETDLTRSSHGVLTGRGGYGAYMGTWEGGFYVAWYEDDGELAKKWRREANSFRRVGEAIQNREKKTMVGQPCNTPGSPSKKIDLLREVQFEVSGENTEYWFCIDLTNGEHAIEIHLYTGPKLTPGFNGRVRGGTEIALFSNNKQLHCSTSSSGIGGHHYSDSKLFEDLDPGRYTIRITSHLFKEGRLSMVVVRNQHGRLGENPIETKYRKMD